VIASGFSDGASYALALARINDLFTRVGRILARFCSTGCGRGKPEVYITHGNADPILPFEATASWIVAHDPAGYTVTLKQFTGGHTVPPDLAREAFRWAIASREATVALTTACRASGG
jgi:predicted esterase